MNLPKRVTIELTNRCNRFCEECPRQKMKYPLGDMNWQLFHKIVEQLPQSTVIVPFFRGEPLLYPQFQQAMRKLRYFDNVQIATNGDFINERTEKALLSCSFVSLSLHEFTPPLGKARLAFLKNARKNGTETQVSILETLIPEGQKEGFVDAWLEHADKVRIYVEHSHRGFGDVGEFETVWSVNDGSLPCHKPFEEMVVYWDGKVALCNHDWNHKRGLDDLNLHTVEQAWNGLPYRLIRHHHKKGERRKVVACKNCDYWMTSYLENKMFGELYTN